MASFWVQLVLVKSLVILPLLSSSTHLNSQASSNSASPAFRTNSPQSQYQDLSPDISPLLPSSGAAMPSPTDSSIPTIPADPSPPNPDDLVEPGSDNAFPPLGSLPASTSSPHSFAGLAVYVGCTCSTYWLMQLFWI